MLIILTVEHAVVIASIGASAFIVFAMPRNITARPRRVIGGHLVGFLSGSLLALIPHTTVHASILVYSLAVGLSILLMGAFGFGHAPASGTALGVAIGGFSAGALIAVVTSSILLSLTGYLLKKYLRDLV